MLLKKSNEVLCLLLGCLLISACAAKFQNAETLRKYVFAATNDSIATYQVASNGSLSLSSIQSNLSFARMEYEPVNHLIFTFTTDSPSIVATYSVSTSTGQLLPLSTTTISSVHSVALSPNGKYLATEDNLLGHLYVYKITPETGSLTLIQTLTTSSNIGSIKYSPQGDLLYNSGLSGNNTIYIYNVDPDTGTVSNSGLALYPTMAALMSIDPLFGFLFAFNSNRLTIFKNESSGITFTFRQGEALSSDAFSAVEILRNYSFYFALLTSGKVSAYGFSSGGSSTLINASINTGGSAVGIALNTSGTSLYILNNDGSGLNVLSIDSAQKTFTEIQKNSSKIFISRSSLNRSVIYAEIASKIK